MTTTNVCFTVFCLLTAITHHSNANPLDSVGVTTLTEGQRFRVAAIRPEPAPGEILAPDSLMLILTSQNGSRVTIDGSRTIEVPANVVVTTKVDHHRTIDLRGDRPFTVSSYQDLWGNGEQAYHLPTYAWGTLYHPFAWWQDSYSVNDGPVTTSTAKTLIITSEPITTVRITKRTDVIDTVLRNNEMLLVSEDVDSGGTRDIRTDPTGYSIWASSPIAVVSGHAKGAVLRFPDGLPPTGDYARPASRSRGNMHDAMLPDAYAGTTFVTAPLLYTPTRQRGWKLDEVGIEDDLGDVVRFIALEDSTEIRSTSDSMADHVDTVMNQGDVWYAPRVEQATVWTANRPVLCMQYGKSFGRIVSQATRPDEDPSVDAGQPLLQAVPSIDHWTNNSTFLAHQQTSNFLNIVCTTSDAEQVRINDSPLTTSLRKHPIGGTSFVAYSGMIGVGEYRVTTVDAAARFCAWTYGSLDGLQLGKIYGSVAGMDLAIPCDDTLNVNIVNDADSVVITYSVTSNAHDCSGIANAFIERCNGGLIRESDGLFVITRATPTSMVTGSVMVVTRSGKYERRSFFLDGTTSVEEDVAVEWIVRPHPVDDICRIRGSAGLVLNGTIQVSTLSGVIVHTQEVRNEVEIILDLGRLPAGVYVISGCGSHRLVVIR